MTTRTVAWGVLLCQLVIVLILLTSTITFAFFVDPVLLVFGTTENHILLRVVIGYELVMVGAITLFLISLLAIAVWYLPVFVFNSAFPKKGDKK